MTDEPSSGRRTERAQLLLVVALFVVHAIFLLHSFAGDGQLRAEALRLLLDEGRLSDKRYSLIGPLFAAPWFLLDRWLGTGDWLTTRHNVVVVAVGMFGLWRCVAACGHRALASSFVLLLMTASMFPFTMMTFYGEPFSALTIGIGLYGLVRGAGVWPWPLLLLGTCNAPPLLLPLSLICGLRVLANRDWRPLLAPVVAFAAMMLENALRRGSPFAFGYDDDWKLNPGLLPYTGRGGFSYPLLLGVYGLLLAPGVGLLFYAPGLFLAGRRDGPDGALGATMRLWLLFLFGAMLAYAKWWAWHGMVYWGTRFLLIGSLPATLLLAWYARRTDLSLRGNLLTLLVLSFSFWVGADGTAFHFFHALYKEPAARAADGAASLFVPELSPLFYPFVRPELPAHGEWPYLALIALTFVWVVAPVARRTFRQLPAAVAPLRQWIASTPGLRR